MVKIMVWVVKIGQLVLMKIAFYAKNKQKMAILNMTSYLLTSKYFNKIDINGKGTKFFSRKWYDMIYFEEGNKKYRKSKMLKQTYFADSAFF